MLKEDGTAKMEIIEQFQRDTKLTKGFSKVLCIVKREEITTALRNIGVRIYPAGDMKT